MKKAFTLFAMLAIAVSATFAQTDSTATNTAAQSNTSTQVVVTQQQQQQPVSKIQAIKQQKQAQKQQQQAQKQQQQAQQQQQPAQQQQQPAQQTSVGVYKAMRGTYVTFRGHAPYKTMPTYDGKEALYWPRFGLQIGAGQAISFFTYEGVLEYMQTTHPYYDHTGATVTEYINTLQGSVRFGGMVPIQLGSRLVLIPNVKGALGGNFSFYSGVSSQFTAGVIGGLDFGIKLGANKMVTLGFVYEYRWYVNRSTTFGIDFLGGQLGIVL